MIASFGAELLQVLLVSLVFGAGLPVLFSLGMRALAWEDAAGHTTPKGRAVAWTMFALCGLVVAFGILTIVAKGFGLDL